MSYEKTQLKPQVISLYKVSAPCKIPLKSNRYNDLYNSYASMQLAPGDYWTKNNQKNQLAIESRTVFSIRLTNQRFESEFSICGRKTCPSLDH